MNVLLWLAVMSACVGYIFVFIDYESEPKAKVTSAPCFPLPERPRQPDFTEMLLKALKIKQTDFKEPERLDPVLASCLADYEQRRANSGASADGLMMLGFVIAVMLMIFLIAGMANEVLG